MTISALFDSRYCYIEFAHARPARAYMDFQKRDEAFSHEPLWHIAGLELENRTAPHIASRENEHLYTTSILPLTSWVLSLPRGTHKMIGKWGNILVYIYIYCIPPAPRKGTWDLNFSKKYIQLAAGNDRSSVYYMLSPLRWKSRKKCPCLCVKMLLFFFLSWSPVICHPLVWKSRSSTDIYGQKRRMSSPHFGHGPGKFIALLGVIKRERKRRRRRRKKTSARIYKEQRLYFCCRMTWPYRVPPYIHFFDRDSCLIMKKRHRGSGIQEGNITGFIICNTLFLLIFIMEFL